jgi:peptidyl-prolyl cis-trans isomerase A (cyclophilin A)
VKNFVGLASGTKEWTDPVTREKVKKPLYDGTLFHRVIPQFMIQGGDPLGTGTGGPGYRFEDEIGPANRFDRPGLLAMANAGPNTNGSQFFITEVPTPHLNRGHTIFGEVVKGGELVAQIARAGNAKVKLEKVVVTRGAVA